MNSSKRLNDNLKLQNLLYAIIETLANTTAKLQARLLPGISLKLYLLRTSFDGIS